MAERIFALHRSDLPTAQQLADQLLRERGQRPWITVVDPVMHHYAISQSMTDVRLMPLPDCGIAVQASARAMSATRCLQTAADEVLATLIPEARGAGWLAHWLRMLFTTAYGFRSIGQTLAERLPRDEAIHLLVPDLPHRYGFHSRLPSLMVNDALRAGGHSPMLYQCTLQPWDEMLLPDPLVNAPGHPAGPVPEQVDLLCHLPTCFYDQPMFASELQASGRTAMVLPSQLFDVALDGLPRCGLSSPGQLMARLPNPQRERLAQLLERLAPVLTAQLGPLISSAGPTQAQVKVLLESVRDQVLLFWTLEARFAGQPPQTLVISNHDTGQHGALLSYARRHGLKTVMLPHSKVFNVAVLSSGHDVLCLHHAVQGGEIADLDGNRMPSAVLDFQESLQVAPAPVRPLATLGLVLNGLASNSMCMVDLRQYLQGLDALRQWCARHGVACRIRCRPNESVATMLVAELGLSARTLIDHQQGSLVEFAQGCDLVVGYDMPTSGAIELLRHGLPMMQALCRRLSAEEWRITDARLVPQLPVAEVLARLDGFLADPQQLWRFRRDQLSDFVAAGRGALPLRHWL